jgi:hypothetical protein
MDLPGSTYMSKVEQTHLPKAFKNMDMVCGFPRANLLAFYQNVQDYL